MINQIFKKEVQENMEMAWQKIASTPYVSIENYQDFLLTYSVLKHPIFNNVLRCCLEAENLDEKIDRVVNFYKEKNLPFCWWVNLNKDPQNLTQQLNDRNFILSDDVEGMFLPLSEKCVPAMECPEDIRIEVVESSQQFCDWITPLAIAFQIGKEEATSFKNIFEELNKKQPSVSRHYLAYYQGKPTSTLSLFLNGTEVGLYNASTSPEARNKGILTSVVLQALQDAKSCGCEYAVLQANSASKNLFRKIGFESCLAYQVFVHA